MKYAVLDFETTGSTAKDNIIQAGLVIIQDERIVEQYGTLVYTDQKIPPDIVQLTGISNQHLIGAPTLQQVMQDLSDKLAGAVFVAHNASFDLGFLQRSLEQCGLPRFTGRVLDSVEMARICFPTLAGLNLGMLAAHFGIVHDRPHQADSDAQATAEVWLRCLQRLAQLPLLVIQRVDELLRAHAQADLSWFFQTVRTAREHASALDLQAHRYYRRFSLGVRDWGDQGPVRSGEPSFADVPFQEFYATLKDKLQQKFARYEERPAQDEMIHAVYETLAEQRHLLVEAGTGTGKSLAYLISTLFYALLHEQKMVVSTHTINLMEQLVTRDVPLLQELWPDSFRAAIVKGRGHYLCLRKFEHTINGTEFQPTNEFFITAAQMLVWLNDTEHGDDEELQFWTKGKDFWRLVESDSQSCLNRACPWYKKCFYHRARNEAAQADLIITNHSLVFSDLATEHRILPAYNHLVVDEAHHFEAAASKHFGFELTYFGFLNVLLWLYRDARSGQLVQLKQRLQTMGDDDLRALAVTSESVFAQSVALKEAWEQLNEVMYLLVSTEGDTSVGEHEQYVLRLRPEAPPHGWAKLQGLAKTISEGSTSLLRYMEQVGNALRGTDYEQEMQGFMTDLSGTAAQLQRVRETLDFFMLLTGKDYVFWLEGSSRQQAKSMQYIAAPIDVSGMLGEQFFQHKESVIMTSATLTVDRDFQHVTEQLGLTQAAKTKKLRTLQLQSPFRYDRQALVCIPNDFPSVKGNQLDSTFLQALSQSLADVAQVTGGRMLVLFTSNKMLKQVFYSLQARCNPHGIHVIGQNITTPSRSKLTRMFQERERCILLGTSSFWEGVDIPGDALSCLAIVRLPFQPPNHPLYAAKSEQLQQQKQNSFMKLAVPQAVIRFKQGFGRLIRTASDRGVVLIYDTRVIDTRYGKHFLHSLPGPRLEPLPAAQIPDRVAQWLQDLDDR
jgi:ATP-dependent DNA helicase DinG